MITVIIINIVGMMMMMMMIGQGMEGNCPRVWAKPHPRIPPALWPPWPGARRGLIIIIISISIMVVIIIIVIFIIIIIIIAS